VLLIDRLPLCVYTFRETPPLPKYFVGRAFGVGDGVGVCCALYKRYVDRTFDTVGGLFLFTSPFRLNM
jgi:hypothetical protein